MLVQLASVLVQLASVLVQLVRECVKLVRVCVQLPKVNVKIFPFTSAVKGLVAGFLSVYLPHVMYGFNVIWLSPTPPPFHPQLLILQF